MIKKIKKKLRYYLEIITLLIIRNKEFHHHNLLKKQNFNEIFKNHEALKSYNDDEIILNEIRFPELTGGINNGDQKAIFFLIKYFKPKRILEIGTHIGASTFFIASAMKSNNLEDAVISTVDIKDTNDDLEKPWLKYKSKNSPLQNVKSIGMEKKVNFFVSDSISFLKKQEQKYDFIFLDGSHKAKDVYNEINLSLKLLNKNGTILLHDYFSDGKKKWNDKDPITGPYLAVKKIIKINPKIKVYPFYSFPWKTKLDTNFTTLALLTRLD